MKKRIIASLLTASMLAAALAGCGGSTAQTADTSADAAGEAGSAQGDPATVTEKRDECVRHGRCGSFRDDDHILALYERCKRRGTYRACGSVQ